MSLAGNARAGARSRCHGPAVSNRDRSVRARVETPRKRPWNARCNV
jgi:hypothetical protein